MTLKLNGSSSGYTAIDAPAAAGSNTLVLPPNNGSANQILQTDGSGNLTWVDKPSATGWHKIASTTHSSGATIDIEDTAAFDGTYDFIKVYVYDIRPANDNVFLKYRIKQSGSYHTGTDYHGNVIDWRFGTNTTDNDNTNSQTAGKLTPARVGNAADDSCHMVIDITKPNDSTIHPVLNWKAWGKDGSGENFTYLGSSMCDGNAASVAWTGLQLLTSSGNLAGKVTTYGLTK